MDEEGVGFYAKIPVELRLRGRYHELAKFFYNVGRLERVINLENINLNLDTRRERGSDTEEGDIILGAQVLATTFRALEDTVGGGGG
jgi:type IV pilus assembly protein PilO